jgi:hypothetical protein
MKSLFNRRPPLNKTPNMPQQQQQPRPIKPTNETSMYVILCSVLSRLIFHFRSTPATANSPAVRNPLVANSTDLL